MGEVAFERYRLQSLIGRDPHCPEHVIEQLARAQDASPQRLVLPRILQAVRLFLFVRAARAAMSDS